jgi:alpha-L-rhamnosidase
MDSEGGVCWNTGSVHSKIFFSVVYAGKPFTSFTVYKWHVRVSDNFGNWSDWSAFSWFETAILSPADLKAKWISTHTPVWYTAGQWESGVPGQQTEQEKGLHTYGIYLSTRVQLAQPHARITRARAYVTGVGLYQLYLGQEKVGERVLTPSQTDYRKRVLYDVLPLAIDTEELAITLFLGNGRHIALYGFGKPCGYVQVLLEYENSAQQWICSDASWVLSSGPVQQNSLFNGEVYDSRIELGNYTEEPVEEVTGYPLYAGHEPPIMINREIQPVCMWRVANGYVYDFGQNFSGFVSFHGKQPSGTQITFQFAEDIYEDGRINPSSNRKAESLDTLICNGSYLRWYPVSTYHGFRYVLVSGYVGVPTLEHLVGLFVHTEVKAIGSFYCSNEDFNRVHQAILWGLRSNMMGIPTDSPQRDERHGWLGDALLAAPAALLNYDVQVFYEKYLQDIADTQNEDGSITDVAPKFWMAKPADPAWGSAFITIGWYLYLYRGDTQVLARFYSAFRHYLEYVLSQTTEGIVEDLGTFGDWCAPGLVTSKKTGLPFISTWYLHHDLSLMEQIAQVLENSEDVLYFRNTSKRIKDALITCFWKGNHMESLPMTPWDFPDQTAQALTLAGDLLDIQELRALATSLNDLVAATSGDHVGTGIHGTRYLLEQLSRWGYLDKAYTIANQKNYPGWIYMVREGATTLWERWEPIFCEGMNSHNHIMLGSIDQWFYTYVAGLTPLAPGWREIGLAPAYLQQIDHAAATVETPYGEASLQWERRDGEVVVTIRIPSGTDGYLFLPPEMNLLKFLQKPTGVEVALETKASPLNPYQGENQNIHHIPPGLYQIVCTVAEGT